jgi:hypothetical protein
MQRSHQVALLSALSLSTLAAMMMARGEGGNPGRGWRCKLSDCPPCQGVVFEGVNFCCDQELRQYPKCLYVTSHAYSCENVVLANQTPCMFGPFGPAQEKINSICLGNGCDEGTYTGRQCGLNGSFQSYPTCLDPS